jgi:hypothetical protein
MTLIRYSDFWKDPEPDGLQEFAERLADIIVDGGPRAGEVARAAMELLSQRLWLKYGYDAKNEAFFSRRRRRNVSPRIIKIVRPLAADWDLNAETLIRLLVDTKPGDLFGLCCTTNAQDAPPLAAREE